MLRRRKHNSSDFLCSRFAPLHFPILSFLSLFQARFLLLHARSAGPWPRQRALQIYVQILRHGNSEDLDCSGRLFCSDLFALFSVDDEPSPPSVASLPFEAASLLERSPSRHEDPSCRCW